MGCNDVNNILCAKWAQMDKAGTQEAGGRQGRHCVGSQAGQSTLMLCSYRCLELASDCEVLLGTTVVIKEPVELAAGGGDGYC